VFGHGKLLNKRANQLFERKILGRLKAIANDERWAQICASNADSLP
jgi:hypothetical protein